MSFSDGKMTSPLHEVVRSYRRLVFLHQFAVQSEIIRDLCAP